MKGEDGGAVGSWGYTLEELQDLLGLASLPATRARVNALRELLEERRLVRRGRNNQLEILPEGLELLRKLVEYEQRGLTIRQAARQVHEDLTGGAAPWERAVAELRETVEVLSARVKELEERVGRLEERRPWYARWFRWPALKPPSQTKE